MNGVTFGTNHSYKDFGLILSYKTIGVAEPKTGTVDIPGADGELDYTESLGDVKFKNRTLTFEFSTITNPKEFLSLYSHLQNNLNGKRMRITLDDDSEFYYIGRVKVNEWASNSRIGKIVIDVNAEPYKLKNNITVISQIISETTAFNCSNLRKRVVPKITASAEVKVVYGGYSVMFSGERTDDEIVFNEGQNALIITPTNPGTAVSIEYQEGGL